MNLRALGEDTLIPQDIEEESGKVGFALENESMGKSNSKYARNGRKKTHWMQKCREKTIPWTSITMHERNHPQDIRRAEK